MKKTIVAIMEKIQSGGDRSAVKTELPGEIKAVLEKNFPTFSFIRKNINGEKALKTIYKVYGSKGIGGEAKVPWVGILNSTITQTTTRGYYLVYLFREDGKSVYLSLNQGVTDLAKIHPKGKKIKLKDKLTAYSREILQYIPEARRRGLDVSRLDLLNIDENNSVSYGYQFADILHKRYDFENMPSEDEMEDDLVRFMKIYHNLVNEIPDYNSFIDNSLENGPAVGELKKEFVEDKRSVNNWEDGEVGNFRKLSEKRRLGKIGDTPAKKTNTLNETMRNYLSENDLKSAIGKFGELLALKEFKTQYPEKDFKIEHVSQNSATGIGNDSLGYDFEIRDRKTNHIIYIDVKTTTNKNNIPFDVSLNEKNMCESVLKSDKKTYIFYRIYGLNSKKKTFNVDEVIIDSSNIEKYYFKAVSFKLGLKD